MLIVAMYYEMPNCISFSSSVACCSLNRYVAMFTLLAFHLATGVAPGIRRAPITRTPIPNLVSFPKFGSCAGVTCLFPRSAKYSSFKVFRAEMLSTPLASQYTGMRFPVASYCINVGSPCACCFICMLLYLRTAILARANCTMPQMMTLSVYRTNASIAHAKDETIR